MRMSYTLHKFTCMYVHIWCMTIHIFVRMQLRAPQSRKLICKIHTYACGCGVCGVCVVITYVDVYY